MGQGDRERDREGFCLTLPVCAVYRFCASPPPPPCICSQEEMKVALDHPPQLKAVTKGVVMQPVDIAEKAMAIREQLALEWAKDLANIEVSVFCFLGGGGGKRSFFIMRRM